MSCTVSADILECTYKNEGELEIVSLEPPHVTAAQDGLKIGGDPRRHGAGLNHTARSSSRVRWEIKIKLPTRDEGRARPALEVLVAHPLHRAVEPNKQQVGM